MKKLLFLSFAVLSLAACESGSNGPELPQPHVISFESLKMGGQSAEFSSGTIDGLMCEYKDVVWGKEHADDATYDFGEDWDDDDRYVPYKLYHGLLFTDADGFAKFGSYYDNGEYWGYGLFDTWYGFAASKNYNNTATAMDYADQFSVWASHGANGTNTFAVCYYPDPYFIDEDKPYMIPTIEFGKACEVQSFWVANTTTVYTYKSYSQDKPTLTLTVTAYLDNKEVGKKDVELIGASGKISDWSKVDCSFGGNVDKLVFSAASNDIMMPTYFCIDEITVVY